MKEKLKCPKCHRAKDVTYDTRDIEYRGGIPFQLYWCRKCGNMWSIPIVGG